MKKCNAIDWVAMVLVIIGGLNWGLVGVMHMDIVAKVFGDMTMVTRVVYDLVGLSALYMAYKAFACKGKSE